MDLPPVPCFEGRHHQLGSPHKAFTTFAEDHSYWKADTYITPCEIPTLEHESGNNPMDAATLVPKTLLSGTKSAEVLGCLGYYVAVELDADSSRWSCAGQKVSTGTICTK